MRRKTLDIIMMGILLMPNVTVSYISVFISKSDQDLWFVLSSLIIALIVFASSIYEMKDDKEFKNFGWYTILVMPGINVILLFVILVLGGFIYMIESFKKFRKNLK